MQTDFIDVTFVVDRSGSMQKIATDTEGGIQSFIDKQRQQPGRCVMSLVKFDTIYEVVYAGVDVANVQPFKLEPRGCTALYDAVCKTIDDVGARLAAMPEADRPGTVMIVIATDGQENASREFTREITAQKIKHQTEKYNWVFVYVGANQDAFSVANGIGISQASALNYTANSKGTSSMYNSLADNTSILRTARLKNAGAGFNFSQSDHDAQQLASRT